MPNLKLKPQRKCGKQTRTSGSKTYLERFRKKLGQQNFSNFLQPFLNLKAENQIFRLLDSHDVFGNDKTNGKSTIPSQPFHKFDLMTGSNRSWSDVEVESNDITCYQQDTNYNKLETARAEMNVNCPIIAPDGYVPNSICRRNIKIFKYRPKDFNDVEERLKQDSEEAKLQIKVIVSELGISIEASQHEGKQRVSTLKKERLIFLQDIQTQKQDQLSKTKQQFLEEAPNITVTAGNKNIGKKVQQKSARMSVSKFRKAKSKIKQVLMRQISSIPSQIDNFSHDTYLDKFKLGLEKYVLGIGDRRKAIDTLCSILEHSLTENQRKRSMHELGLVGGSRVAQDLVLLVIQSSGCLLNLLSEVMCDRGKIADLLQAAALEGSFVAFEKLVRRVPNTQFICDLINAFTKTRYETKLFLATHLKLMSVFPLFWDTIVRYDIDKRHYDKILRGRWVPHDEPDTKRFWFTINLELELKDMFIFMSLLKELCYAKLANLKPHYSVYVKKVCAQYPNICKRIGKPGFLDSLSSMTNMHSLLNLVNKPAIFSQKLSSEICQSKDPFSEKLSTFQEYVDHFVDHWEELAAWEAISDINAQCKPAFEQAKLSVKSAMKMFPEAVSNIRTHSDVENPQQLLQQALFDESNAVRCLEKAVTQGRAKFVLHTLHSAFGQALLDLIRSVLDGEPAESVCGFLTTIQKDVDDLSMERMFAMWKVWLFGMENSDKVLTIQTVRVREEEFKLVKEFVTLIAKCSKPNLHLPNRNIILKTAISPIPDVLPQNTFQETTKTNVGRPVRSRQVFPHSEFRQTSLKNTTTKSFMSLKYEGLPEKNKAGKRESIELRSPSVEKFRLSGLSTGTFQESVTRDSNQTQRAQSDVEETFKSISASCSRNTSSEIWFENSESIGKHLISSFDDSGSEIMFDSTAGSYGSSLNEAAFNDNDGVLSELEHTRNLKQMTTIEDEKIAQADARIMSALNSVLINRLKLKDIENVPTNIDLAGPKKSLTNGYAFTRLQKAVSSELYSYGETNSPDNDSVKSANWQLEQDKDVFVFDTENEEMTSQTGVGNKMNMFEPDLLNFKLIGKATRPQDNYFIKENLRLSRGRKSVQDRLSDLVLRLKPGVMSSAEDFINNKQYRVFNSLYENPSSDTCTGSADTIKHIHIHKYKALTYYRPDRVNCDMKSIDFFSLQLLDMLVKQIQTFGDYTDREMTRVAELIFNRKSLVCIENKISKSSVFENDPKGAYMKLFRQQLNDFIDAGISIECSNEFVKERIQEILDGALSMGTLGIKPPKAVRLLEDTLKYINLNDEPKMASWSDRARVKLLGPSWKDSIVDASNPDVFIPLNKSTSRPAFWKNVSIRKKARNKKIVESLKNLESAERIERRTPNHSKERLRELADDSEVRFGHNARIMRLMRVQNPYLDALGGQPVRVNSVMTAATNHIVRATTSVYNNIQFELERDGFTATIIPPPPIKQAKCRFITRPTNIPVQDWRRLIGRQWRCAIRTSNVSVCHRARDHPLISIDNLPYTSGNFLRNVDLVNVIHEGCHQDNMLRQEWLYQKSS